jgi:hypothetical protein
VFVWVPTLHRLHEKMYSVCVVYNVCVYVHLKEQTQYSGVVRSWRCVCEREVLNMTSATDGSPRCICFGSARVEEPLFQPGKRSASQVAEWHRMSLGAAPSSRQHKVSRNSSTARALVKRFPAPGSRTMLDSCEGGTHQSKHQLLR